MRQKDLGLEDVAQGKRGVAEGAGRLRHRALGVGLLNKRAERIGAENVLFQFLREKQGAARSRSKGLVLAVTAVQR